MDETETLSPPINSVMLLRSVVVVTTLIVPAWAVVKIPNNEIKKKISLFFMLSSLKFLMTVRIQQPYVAFLTIQGT
jgi:hypothetical protein